MAGNKYLANVSGRVKEMISAQTSAGAADAGKIVALGSDGKLDSTVLPAGLGADSKVMTASEALAAGDYVNIWSDAGVGKIRKADATTEGKEADGFVLAAVASGATGTIYFEGMNTQLTGLTPGSRYYLATTPGTVTATPPATSGNVVQYIGRAVSATEINFEASNAITVA